MEKFSTTQLRNVAVVGQAGSGKTTLVEAILMQGGAINRKGRIEDGNTQSDTELEEISHHHSIRLALCSMIYKSHKINLLDTPGISDFLGEVKAAFAACDSVMFVVSGAEAVNGDLIRLWEEARGANIPSFIFVNKMDREHSSFNETISQLQSATGQSFSPVELPIGSAQGFQGIADLITDAAFSYNSGQSTSDTLPSELQDLEHELHDAVVEEIVLGDEVLMERYLEGQPISTGELERTMSQEMSARLVFPVLCGSALQDIAVDRLLDFIVDIAPPPASNAEGDRAPVIAQAFKTLSDPYIGKLTLLKVHSGQLEGDKTLLNLRSGNEERIHGLFSLRGKEHLTTTTAVQGDIVCAAKLNTTLTSDTLVERSGAIPPTPITSIAFDLPTLTIALSTKVHGEDEKLYSALTKIVEEDPALSLARDSKSHQLLLSGLGDTHLSITLERVRRKYSIEMVVSEPQTLLFETISVTSEAEGKYKKQTGGHGQFAVVKLRISPLPRGTGFAFKDEIVGGAIPRNYIPSVERGVLEAMASGGHFGLEVTDIAVSLLDGKFHSVDSSELSFKMAGVLAFKEALEGAGAIVLEPIAKVSITLPYNYQGEILGDLNARRAKVISTRVDASGKSIEITAMVPQGELNRYASTLRGLSAGQARFTSALSHYEEAPPSLIERLSAKAHSERV